MVVGEYRKFPGALIVPNFAALRERLALWASQHEGDLAPTVTDSELIRLPRVRALIAGEIDGVNKDLAQYARIKNFALLAAEWTTAGGELTPTQKIKRREVLKKFAVEIEGIYADVAPTA